MSTIYLYPTLLLFIEAARLTRTFFKILLGIRLPARGLPFSRCHGPVKSAVFGPIP